MRVAINAWFWDQPAVGSGQYLKYLIPALLAADDQLEIILISPKPFLANVPANSRAGNVPDQLEILPGQAESRLKSYRLVTPFRHQESHLAKVWFEQITFPRACQKLGADIAHVPYFGSPLAPVVPTVVTIHDLIPMVLTEYRGSALVRLYTSLVAAAAPQARIILTDSEASRRDIIRHLSLPPQQVRLVYLAPAPHFQPAESWEQIIDIKRKYNLPENFVLYLGGYDIRKNVSALLHAYTWVSATLQDQYPLVLAGRLPETDSAFSPDPRRIARELGIAQYIGTPGWIAEEDKPLLYAAATVFVFPSRYEGFGLPVLEAMASGTPVVTTNAASIPELAGAAAFQVDPDDTRHMAAPIIRLCTDEAFNEEMIERGFDQVEKFTWIKTAQETLQAYRGIRSR